MIHRIHHSLVFPVATALVGALAGALLPAPAVAQAATGAGALDAAQLTRIDSIFARYARPDAAGCALGVSRRDTTVLEKAWGSAQLELAVPNTPATIFEPGSVTKQFTAAAVLRLAQMGRLSLDDDVRKYVPEVPTYDAPITIRHLIHHTSGLRDWGAVAAMAGWPRGTRTYTHAHVLEIIGRQRALNHPVGAEYLYSNSNYNLLAIIAERVSGKSLPEFTRAELFEPLGMTHTSWRDDYTRVVPGRAQAYVMEGGGWHLQMPNENVYGNSSLLTTVGDLLKWSANFGHQRVGGAPFVSSQLERGRLTSGREISYASGVVVDSFAGTPEISHDGATAGYRGFLARYPDAGWSVALLCNAGNVNPSQVGRRVAEIVLRRSPPAPAATASADTVGRAVEPTRLEPLAGVYRSARNDEPLRLVVAGGRLRQPNGPPFVAVGDRHFTSPSGRAHLLFDASPAGTLRRLRVWTEGGDTTDYLPAGAPATRTALSEYVGTYQSDEAEVALSVAMADSGLVLLGRPSARMPLTPIYKDGFTAQGSYVRFTRGANGRLDGFLMTAGRARNVRFVRVAAAAATSLHRSR